MDSRLIERHFADIGARAKVHFGSPRNRTSGLTIDIGHDSRGEFFDISVARPELDEVRIVDAQPGIRHLLLMFEQADGKHKFLC